MSYDVADVVSFEDSDVQAPRIGGEFVHVANMVKGLCPRAESLALSYGIPDSAKEAVGPAMKLVWMYGRAFEAYVRDKYIQSEEGHRVLGNWTCLCGYTEVTQVLRDDALNDRVCGRCLSPANVYNEMTLYDYTHRIVGNPDFLVVDDEGKAIVYEFKTKKHEYWDELTEPEADHVYQAACYNKLLTVNDIPTTDYVYIVYGTKGYPYRSSPYKTYKVDVSTEAIQTCLDGMWSDAQRVQQAVVNSATPPRELCSSPTCSEAKKCPMVMRCFMED